MNRRSKFNPLSFDNRFAPEPMKRYKRSRNVASIVAPPRQRVQAARLAESPHNFRVVVRDGHRVYLPTQEYSQPGTITLILSLAQVDEIKGGNHLYSAFMYVHRLGDQMLDHLEPFVRGGNDLFHLYRAKQRGWPEGSYVPNCYPSERTTKAAAELAAQIKRVVGGLPHTDKTLPRFIAKFTNSEASRKGRIKTGYADYGQAIADWVALSELPGARARAGRGEPWLLIPPPEGAFPAAKLAMLREYAEVINTYFPPFIQSVLSDFEEAGGVFDI